jgi:hypothetical protein
LDFAVAVIEGYEVCPWPELGESYWRIRYEGLDIAYVGAFNVRHLKKVAGLQHYNPTRNPAMCSEIVERERIGTVFDTAAGEWLAGRCGPGGALPEAFRGENPRVAALRCFVASHKEKLKAILPAI